VLIWGKWSRRKRMVRIEVKKGDLNFVGGGYNGI
jgi:hypothetical protein